MQSRPTALSLRFLICTIATTAFLSGPGMLSSAEAGIPLPATARCEATASSSCPEVDAIWCPSGDLDTIFVRATVRSDMDELVPDCLIRLDVTSAGTPDPSVGAGTQVRLCGTGEFHQLTDANGVVAFPLFGGGCGSIEIRWILTAECAFPEIELCTDSTTFDVRSPDFNGSLHVNFFDTFKYLPALNVGTGSCQNLNCSADGDVNFFDTFDYLHHLAGQHSCN